MIDKILFSLKKGKVYNTSIVFLSIFCRNMVFRITMLECLLILGILLIYYFTEMFNSFYVGNILVYFLLFFYSSLSPFMLETS